MKVIWIGKYFDLNEREEEIEFLFRIDAEMDGENSFAGKVWEEEFFELTKAFIDVEGFIEGNLISFVKTYPFQYDYDENMNALIDRTKPGHQVIYEGIWDENSNSWKGEWEIELEVTQVSFEVDNVISEVNRFEMKEHFE